MQSRDCANSAECIKCHAYRTKCVCFWPWCEIVTWVFSGQMSMTVPMVTSIFCFPCPEYTFCYVYNSACKNHLIYCSVVSVAR